MLKIHHSRDVWNIRVKFSEFQIVNFRGSEFWSLDLDLRRFQTSQQKWLLNSLMQQQCDCKTDVDDILTVT